MMIKITDLPVFLKLGYYEDERLVGQDILVSVDIKLYDHLTPGLSDDLTKTVDYGEIVKLIDYETTGKEVRLIETVVEMIGKSILNGFAMVESLSVSAVKTVIPKSVVRGARVSVCKEFSRQT